MQHPLYRGSRRLAVNDDEFVGVGEVVHCAAVPGWGSGAWDRSGDGSAGPNGSDLLASVAGVSSAAPGQVASAFVVGRVGGDLPRPCAGVLAAGDRVPAGPGTVDGVPGGQP